MRCCCPARFIQAFINAAEMVSYLLPSLISHTRGTPEDVVRVVFSLTMQQALVVFAPKGVLPVRLAGVVLVIVSE